MAILQLENSTTYTNFSDIAEQLAPLNIQIDRLLWGKKQGIPELLARDILSPAQKEQILVSFDHHFEMLKRTAGYKWRELTVLHPGSPYLYALIAQYDRCHIHTDDEGLYILAGECIFGFVLPDGSQVELILQPQDYINVPAGTEHWSCPTASLDLKAVRYFTTASGWTPQYTNTQIHFHQTLSEG